MSAPALEEPGGLAILAEATDLVRSAPLTAHLVYLAGSAPFFLALLEFIGEMSRSPFARGALAGRAVVLALLFVAMKTAHALFCRALLAERRGTDGPRPPLFAVALEQATVQPSALFLLPIAAILTIPYGYVAAYYQSASALGALPREDGRSLSRDARAAAVIWQRQGHAMAGILFLLRVLAFVNTFALVLVAPLLLKTLLGVETVFSRSGSSVLNTTTLAVALVIAHVLVDPLAKAAYALRAFYGLSIGSGEDLKSALARLGAAVAVAAIALLPSALRAAPTPAPAPSVSPDELSRALDVVLRRPEYRWRAPSGEPEESGFLLDLARAVDDTVRRAVRALAKAARDIAEWLGKLLHRSGSSGEAPETGVPPPPKSLLFLLFAASALAVFLLLWRRRAPEEPTAALAVVAEPDVLDESVTADARPADSWLALARELLEKGDTRRALRALYLSALAQLSGTGLLVLAAHKSNGEYAAELARRSVPRLVPPFHELLSDFDASWYGRREVTAELLARTLANVEALRAA